MMRGVSIRTYIKNWDFLSASRVYTVGYTFLGPNPAPARRRPRDVLFDGVSKREILTEQLSPAGIMWADGWREIRLPWNFRRTRYCSERERQRQRGTGAVEGEGWRERTGHTGNLPGELHHSGYHGTPETLAVPNCSLIPTGRYIVWVSASASGAYRIRR